MTRDLSSMLQTLSEEVPSEHLEDPLAYIFADNFRCRVLCNVLDVVGSGKRIGVAALETCRSFLLVDFLTHIADEKKALFPLLLERTTAEDGVQNVIKRTRTSFATVNRVADELARLETGRWAIRSTAGLIQSFVAAEREHIAIENVVVLPVARRRLRSKDLEWLGGMMRDHRVRLRRVPLLS